MEDHLQHDPRTKQAIKDMLYNFLYAPVQRKFKKDLNQIINRNTDVSGYSHRSFTYKGNFYCNDTNTPPRKMNRLHPKMYPEMDKYLGDLKKLNETELPYVIGFITTVLNTSNDLQDYLRIFPDSIHRPIEKLIATCPCRANKLTAFDVECIQKKHATSISLLKERMVINLLI